MDLALNHPIDFLHAILESPKGMVIFALDKNYQYSSFSETHRSIMKTIWGVDIALGMNMLDLIGNDDDRSKAKHNFDKALTGEYFTVVEEYGDVTHLRTSYENRYGPVTDKSGNIIGLSVFVIDITELKQAEHALKESEKRLRSVLNVIPDLIFKINLQGVYTEVFSDATTSQIGLPQTGNSITEGLDSDIADRFLTAIKYCIANQALQTIEYESFKNNTVRNYEARFVPFNNSEALTVIRDTTHQKKSELELLKLSLIARYTSNAVVITDSDGRIEWVNEGFTRITEYTLQEVIGKKPGEFLQGAHTNKDVRNRMQQQIHNKESFNGELVNYSKSGRQYWIQINGQPIYNEAGEVTKYFAIESEVTQRKLAEIKLQEQNTRLTAITENLTRKNEQLEEFTQIVSHNLRSPIGNIGALLEHLNGTEDEAERNEIINHLKNTSSLLMLTMQELNEVLKIKYAGHIVKEKLSFQTMFDKVRQMLLVQINQTNASVTSNFTRAATLVYSPIYLESILLNLLSNALKYSSPKRKPIIHFETQIKENTAVLLVSDNGMGIDLNRYGHQIFKLRKTFHPHPESRGVGLFMIKNQIEALGGTITITSQADEGTTFTINFGANENYGG